MFERCINPEEAPEESRKSPGNRVMVLLLQAGRKSRPSENFLLNGAKINKLRTVDANSPN